MKLKLKSCLLLGFIFCASNILAKETDWVLAASSFSVTASEKTKSIVEESAVSIPKMILEYLEEKGGRIMAENELESRALYDLKIEREALFLELTKEIQNRDLMIFTNESRFSRSRAEKEFKKKIAATQKKINENLSKTKNPLGKNQTKKNGKLVKHESTMPGDRLLISLWKNDSEVLFENKKANETEKDFENRIRNENISGLITGDIVERAGFLQVSVKLTIYPLNQVVATVSDIGSLTDLQTLSAILAKELLPFVLNSTPVKLKFDITPPEAASVAKIYIDGSIPDDLENIIVENGKHNVYIYAVGYESKDFTYSFTETDEFLIQVKMPKKEDVIVAFSSVDSDKSLYLNGLPQKDAKNVAIEKGVSLGEVYSEETDNMSYFVLDNQVKDGTSKIVFNDISFDESLKRATANIEKSRRDMYNSYAALLASLPFTFLTNGMKIASKNSLESGRAAPGTYQLWNNFALVSNVLSLSLGTNFLYNLGKYLKDANSTLPQEVILDEENTNKTEKK